jgi:hypothetical protein
MRVTLQVSHSVEIASFTHASMNTGTDWDCTLEARLRGLQGLACLSNREYWGSLAAGAKHWLMHWMW